jgi:RNA polymerase sigma factor (sigma-70 family)
MENSIDPLTFASTIPAYTNAERDTLYRDFQPLIHRLLRQYGDTPDLREELKGEMYSRFSNALDAYDPSRGISLHGYLASRLSTSTYSYARTQWRLRQGREKHETSWELQEEAGLQVGAAWVDPIEEKIQQEEQQQLLGALRDRIEGLTASQRQVVLWRYYDSLSFEEIAKRMGNQPATARSLLRHALNNLSRQLTPLAAEQNA